MRSVDGAPSAATTRARDIPGETEFVRLCAPSATGRMMVSRKTIGRRMSDSSSGCDALEDGLEERQSVGGAEEGINGSLRMGAHTQKVGRLTHDPRDIAHRAIRVVRLLRLQRARCVAKDDLTLSL